MFGVAAVLTFVIAFVLHLVGADLGKVDLLLLGLAFLAAHVTFAIPLRRA
jgi:hypothetical protein